MTAIAFAYAAFALVSVWLVLLVGPAEDERLVAAFVFACVLAGYWLMVPVNF